MRKKMRWASVIVLGGCAMSVEAARASTTYSYLYVGGQSTYTGVTPGSTIDVPLYLQETNSDGSTNSLIASEDGLAGAGLSVNFASASDSGPTTITGISPNSGTPTTGFDDILDQTFTSGSAALLEQVGFSDSDGVAAGPQNDGVSEVFLGTLALQASSNSGETTTFTIGAYDPNNGNTVTFDIGYDLDNNADPLNPAGASDLYFSAASTDFSVTTSSVPEPASLSFLFTVSGLMLVRMHRLVGARPSR